VIGLAFFLGAVVFGSGLMTAVIIAIDRHRFAKPDLSLSRAERKRLYRTLTFGKRYDARRAYRAWSTASTTTVKVEIGFGLALLLLAGLLKIV